MKKWEYDIWVKHYSFIATQQEAQFLKEQGAEGWELVLVRTHGGSTLYYFKRELI